MLHIIQGTLTIAQSPQRDKWPNRKQAMQQLQHIAVLFSKQKLRIKD